MEKTFENKDRRRYYGLRVGDIVQPKSINGKPLSLTEVVELCPGDNNRVKILDPSGKPIDYVAEWCDVVEKVEEKTNDNNLRPSDCKTRFDDSICGSCEFRDFEMVSHPGGDSTKSVERYYCSLGFWTDEF